MVETDAKYQNVVSGLVLRANPLSLRHIFSFPCTNTRKGKTATKKDEESKILESEPTNLP